MRKSHCAWFIFESLHSDICGMDRNLLLKGLVSSNRPDLTFYEELRRQFHAYPELSGQEKLTSEKIASHLRSLKVYEIHERIGGHGVAAVFQNGEGKVILLRADMDALPVHVSKYHNFPMVSFTLANNRKKRDWSTQVRSR